MNLVRLVISWLDNICQIQKNATLSILQKKSATKQGPEIYINMYDIKLVLLNLPWNIFYTAFTWYYKC